MAVTLAHLRAALGAGEDLESSVTQLNQYLCGHSPDNVFVSLWIAVLDRDNHRLRYIDAGHGHWLHRREGQIQPIARETARMPLGIDGEVQYKATEMSLEASDRVIMYSDGASECHRRNDGELEFFGRPRIEEAIRSSSSPAEDVDRIFRAVLSFCGEGGLADDTTVASIDVAP
jgi:sigma-B regulation protein RsbU (phosphoserine phosphatase)